MASSIDYNMASTFARKTVRTMEDGPTTKQKVMVSFIWIGSAFFGITTCFPDKVFGVALSQKIKEDQGGGGRGRSLTSYVRLAGTLFPASLVLPPSLPTALRKVPRGHFCRDLQRTNCPLL